MKDILLVGLLAAVIAGTLYDLVVDRAQGAASLHLWIEGGIFVLAVLLVAWLLNDLRRQRQAISRLRAELADSRPAPSSATPELADTRHRLSALIQLQFETWKLTPGEQAVGLLLLMGLSFREIAAVRDTREKTVRTQASSIYRKAGVNGRHASSAWFIEDFL